LLNVKKKKNFKPYFSFWCSIIFVVFLIHHHHQLLIDDKKYFRVIFTLYTIFYILSLLSTYLLRGNHRVQPFRLIQPNSSRYIHNGR
ncbi:hypothetical protein GLOIN_2v1616365, partial [Rhizophagus irregularis DAOM 181602=DAOM 197198]